ncbi:hypothetical protein BOX15_Mlig033459g3 [Macrostomum lignano]|uniref:Uncharacterized protein n=1 Tax=Macrostomum lignano TaxID=282301 RepID=A0A267E8R8_9PLAT|nr:hypothetical protein BOX15_Mlig033459g3 [Macrostomum lignano]
MINFLSRPFIKLKRELEMRTSSRSGSPERLSTASMLEIDRELAAQQPVPLVGVQVYQQQRSSKSSTDSSPRRRTKSEAPLAAAASASATAAADSSPWLTPPASQPFYQQQQQQQQLVNHCSTAPQRLQLPRRRLIAASDSRLNETSAGDDGDNGESSAAQRDPTPIFRRRQQQQLQQQQQLDQLLPSRQQLEAIRFGKPGSSVSFRLKPTFSDPHPPPPPPPPLPQPQPQPPPPEEDPEDPAGHTDRLLRDTATLLHDMEARLARGSVDNIPYADEEAADEAGGCGYFAQGDACDDFADSVYVDEDEDGNLSSDSAETIGAAGVAFSATSPRQMDRKRGSLPALSGSFVPPMQNSFHQYHLPQQPQQQQQQQEQQNQQRKNTKHRGIRLRLFGGRHRQQKQQQQQQQQQQQKQQQQQQKQQLQQQQHHQQQKQQQQQQQQNHQLLLMMRRQFSASSAGSIEDMRNSVSRHSLIQLQQQLNQQQYPYQSHYQPQHQYQSAWRYSSVSELSRIRETSFDGVGFSSFLSKKSESPQQLSQFSTLPHIRHHPRQQAASAATMASGSGGGTSGTGGRHASAFSPFDAKLPTSSFAASSSFPRNRSRSVAILSNASAATTPNYDSDLLAASLLQVAQKLRRCSDDLLGKLRRSRHLSRTPSPAEELLLRQRSLDGGGGTSGGSNRLPETLHCCIHNLRAVQYQLNLIEHAIFPQAKSGRNSALGSCSESEYLMERDRIHGELRGFRPIDPGGGAQQQQQ